MEILFLLDILLCSGNFRINLHIIAPVIIVLEPLHIGGWCKSSAKDSKMPSNVKMMMILIFSKCCNVSFFQTYDQNSWKMTSSKTFVRSSLRYKQFLVWNQKPNSHLQFKPSIRHFFKNFGNDVTNNDVINFKIIFFKSELENQLLCKTWHFYKFWISCWMVKALWH